MKKKIVIALVVFACVVGIAFARSGKCRHGGCSCKHYVSAHNGGKCVCGHWDYVHDD